MHQFEFTYLINKPDAINQNQIKDLEKIIQDYPYFQSAQSIYLKGLYLQESIKYNQTLKQIAALTTDRAVLFDFITSDDFVGIQKGYYEENLAKINNINVVDSFVVVSEETKNEPETNHQNAKIVELVENKLENSILHSIKVASPDKINSEEIKALQIEISDIEEKLEIGKPLAFNKQEKHSFQEWLQLSRLKPIERNQEVKTEDESSKEEGDNTVPSQNLESKMEIIDKFIENNPKISRPSNETPTPTFSVKSEDTSYLMTETLAKVYLEQKKYNKAIQAYEILILKYPEKSSLFADRILDIKELQQNNK